MARGLLPFLLLAAAGIIPAQTVAPEVLLLARARAAVRQALDGLPDCTCLETVDRLHKPAGGKALRPADTVRLDILFSGERELFASPGDTAWETSMFRFVAGGMMGNGLFALHLKSVFVTNQAIIAWHGEESEQGRTVARFDFEEPLSLSGYTVSRGAVAELVAEKGSFWVDPATSELLRLEIQAVEIPPSLQYETVTTKIGYQRVRIGLREALLPATAELYTRDLDGEENLNRIAFTNCHEYRTESRLSFDMGTAAPPAASAATPIAAKTESRVPPGVSMTIALATPIGDGSAVGSRVEGKIAGGGPAPAGSLVVGRIRRLEKTSEPDFGDYYIVGIEFTGIETRDARLLFSADLEGIDAASGVEMVLTSASPPPGNGALRSTTTIRKMATTQIPGVGTFFVHASRLNLRPGLRMRWKTR
jgi:hypothetical protein